MNLVLEVIRLITLKKKEKLGSLANGFFINVQYILSLKKLVNFQFTKKQLRRRLFR